MHKIAANQNFLIIYKREEIEETLVSFFPNMCYERLLATMHAVLQYPEIVVQTHAKIEITLKLITKG